MFGENATTTMTQYLYDGKRYTEVEFRQLQLDQALENEARQVEAAKKAKAVALKQALESADQQVIGTEKRAAMKKARANEKAAERAIKAEARKKARTIESKKKAISKCKRTLAALQQELSILENEVPTKKEKCTPSTQLPNELQDLRKDVCNPQTTLDNPKEVCLSSSAEGCVPNITTPTVTRDDIISAVKALVCAYANQACVLGDDEWAGLFSNLSFLQGYIATGIADETVRQLVAESNNVKSHIAAMWEVVQFCNQWVKNPNREILHDHENTLLTVNTISFGNVANGNRGKNFTDARLAIKSALFDFFCDHFEDRSSLRSEVRAIIGAPNKE